MKKTRVNEDYVSWKELFKFYRKVRIPWVLLILVFVASIALKETESQLVPFTSKIMTGAIMEHGFLGGYIVMTLLYSIMEAFQGAINELAAITTARNVRHTMWRKIIRLPLRILDKEDTQRFVSRITQDSLGAYAALACLIQCFSVFYGLYTNFVKMFRIYKMVALIMLTGIPLTILVTYICGRLEFSMQKIKNNAYAVITNFFGERLPNLQHIKTCEMEEEEYVKGVQASEDKYKADVKYLNRFIFQAPIGTYAQYFNEVILLLVATALVRQGVMRMPQMVSLYNYYLLFMGNAFMITGMWQALKTSHGACQTIARLAEEEDEDVTSGSSFAGVQEDITFENVSFSYNETTNVLQDFTCIIPKGKITAIVGENGCGKSTTVKLLERFIDPSSGTIRIGNTSLQELNLHDWRNHVGYLSQNDQIIKGSIKENILYGLDKTYSDEEIIEACKKAHAYDFIMAKEKGFDTLISHFDNKLSGGEMQRLAIARILLKQPEYLIMDEATSGVDIINEQELMASIQEVMQEKTVIMVTHDVQMMKKADHIIVVNDGKVEACGNYLEVLDNSQLFRKFIGE